MQTRSFEQLRSFFSNTLEENLILEIAHSLQRVPNGRIVDSPVSLLGFPEDVDIENHLYLIFERRFERLGNNRCGIELAVNDDNSGEEAAEILRQRLRDLRWRAQVVLEIIDRNR